MAKSEQQQLEYDRALKSAKFKLEFTLDNERALLRIRGGSEKLKAAQSFWDRLERIEKKETMEEFTPGMFSYVDAIYEPTWQGLGESHVNTHIDKKRKGINYGHQ